jgi:hypothetical protein
MFRGPRAPMRDKGAHSPQWWGAHAPPRPRAERDPRCPSGGVGRRVLPQQAAWPFSAPVCVLIAGNRMPSRLSEPGCLLPACRLALFWNVCMLPVTSLCAAAGLGCWQM